MRTKYFTTGDKCIWRWKNGRHMKISGNMKNGWWKSSCKPKHFTAAHDGRQITRDEARKICPKAFR